jgi:hypothetical protein
VTARLGPLIVDAADPSALSDFWTAAIGAVACERYLSFRPQREPKTVKNRVHLDLAVREVSSLLDLGARVLADHRPGWMTLADVEGNEFCAFPAELPPGPGRSEPFAVCTDSDRPEALASWWGARVGARIGPAPDRTPRWLRDCAGWEALIWKFVRVDDPRTAPNRWRWSVTAAPGELIAGGATPLPGGTLADPQGNEFSVTDPAPQTG